MINVRRRIQQILANTLHETITWEGSSVPFYSDGPPSTDNLYIICKGNEQREIGTKINFVNEASLNVEVVQRQNPNFVNTRGMDYVAGEVMRLIKPTTASVLNLYPQFGCISVSLEGSPIDDRTLLQAEGVTRILMRWRFHVEKGYANELVNFGYTPGNEICIDAELERLSEL